MSFTNIARVCCTGFACLIFFGLGLAGPVRAGEHASSTETPATKLPGATTPAAPASATRAPLSLPSPPAVGSEDTDVDTPRTPDKRTIKTVDVAAQPTAILTAKAAWDNAFSAIKATHAELKAAVAKAGLKPGGRPLTVFTASDDKHFSYEAMLPLAKAPADGTSLPDSVTLGVSPSGKALLFHYHGPYSGLDSAYDFITSYLSEKSLEAKDYFVEDYLSDLKSADDPSLAVDIYVFLK